MSLLQQISSQISQFHLVTDRNLSELRVLVAGPPLADFIPPGDVTGDDPSAEAKDNEEHG